MPKKNIQAIYQLSPSQEGMLYDSLSSSDSSRYIEQNIWEIRGDLDVCALEQSWRKVIERHPILRTAFVWKDQKEPLQIVLQEVEPSIQFQDWRKYPRSKQAEILDRNLENIRVRGFNPVRAPLHDMIILQIDEKEYCIIRTIHHIIVDGWSSRIINKELLEIYGSITQKKELLLEPAPSFRDYIVWLKKQDLSQAESFWHNKLKGFRNPILLSPNGKPNLSYQEILYETETFSLSDSTSDKLKSLARQNRITLNTLIQSVWALFLKSYTGGSDVVFGFTVSGRPGDIPDVDKIVGPFFNTLPMRIKEFPDQSDLWTWAREIQNQMVEQKSYEYCSAGQIHLWSDVPSSLPLYESVLVFENFPDFSIEQFAAEQKIEILSSRSIGAQTRHDLAILVYPNPVLKFKVVYNKRKIDIKNIMKTLFNLLECIVSEPNRNLDMLLKVALDSIPKKSDGEADVQSLTSAKTPRPELEEEYIAPRNELERQLVKIWEDVLGIYPIGVRDNFFLLGKHSLIALRLFGQIQKVLGKNLPFTTLFQAPTVERLANIIQQDTPFSLLVPINAEGSKPPFFFIHGCGGEVFFSGNLSGYLGQDQPFYGIRAQGLYGEKAPPKNLKDMAASYVEQIKKIQPKGPYYIGTAGEGGLIALEMAQQLLAQNQKIGLLLLVDAIGYVALGSSIQYNSKNLKRVIKRSVRKTINEIKNLKWKFAYSFIPRHVKFIQKKFDYDYHVRMNISSLTRNYIPNTYPGKITFFLSEASKSQFENSWYEIASDGLDLHIIPGDHNTVWKEPNFQILAKHLKDCLDKAINDSEGSK